MENNALDEELIKETIAECNEHFDKSIQLLLDIEKNGEHFRQDYFDKIFRTLHSGKGCLAMVGLNTAADLVHECESLFQKCSIEKRFLTGVIQITIEFMAQLQEAFMHKARDLQGLDYVKYCFPCIEKSAYKEKCENHFNTWTNNLPCRLNEKLPTKDLCEQENVPTSHAHQIKITSTAAAETVLLLGSNSSVLKILEKLDISFAHIYSTDELYQSGHLYKSIETFFIDSNSCKPNPLLLIGIINNLFPAKRIILISNDGALNFNNVVDPDKLIFTFLGAKSKNFENTIALILKKF